MLTQALGVRRPEGDCGREDAAARLDAQPEAKAAIKAVWELPVDQRKARVQQFLAQQPDAGAWRDQNPGKVAEVLQIPEGTVKTRTRNGLQALRDAGAEHLYTINVLEEPEIRANLPRYSNWPTFPQLFINGELIGGCDITLELHESGELQRIVAEALSP